MLTKMIASIAVMSVLIAQTISAPQSRTFSSTVKSPSNMSPEELEHILRTRRGEATVPPKTLSPCARAILGCCNGKVMNGYCSESLKCGAFFFDVNPCEERFVVDALKAAKSFYKQFNKVD